MTIGFMILAAAVYLKGGDPVFVFMFISIALFCRGMRVIFDGGG